MDNIYLDNQATTAVDPRVVDAMLPYFSKHFGNPHSAQHAYGWDAKAAVEQARAEIAAALGARPSEIIFTSGATEANNQAILGVARAQRNEGKRTGQTQRRHLVTTRIEHPCVIAPMELLACEGYELSFVDVDKGGRVNLEQLAKLITSDTLLVSIMAANNEIGVLQDLDAIGALTHAAGAFFHTDAAQAVAKVPIDVNRAHIDLLGLTGHKLYGPMGAGALYIRSRADLAVEPLLIGGGQEMGLRSGTVAAPLAAGLGAACRIGTQELREEAQRLTHLRDTLLQTLCASISDLKVNGDASLRLPGNLNIRKDGVRAVDVINQLEGVALSSASACAAGGDMPSHVLDGIGLSPAEAECCLRIGLGRFTTQAEITNAAARICAAYAGCLETTTA